MQIASQIKIKQEKHFTKVRDENAQHSLIIGTFVKPKIGQSVRLREHFKYNLPNSF
jgi:hypothetical protein